MTEHMRFILSRESIVRFGVPYGRVVERVVGVDVCGAGEEPPPFDWDGEDGCEESGGAEQRTRMGEKQVEVSLPRKWGQVRMRLEAQATWRHRR